MRSVDSVSLTGTTAPGEDVHSWLKRLDRRAWWLLWLALLVILLLMLGLASFSAPRLGRDLSVFAEFQLTHLVRSLLGLVLLFNVYTIYQLVVIKRLRNGLFQEQVRADRFRKLAMFDSLTGAYNRRFAEERLSQEVKRCQRKGYNLTVAILDLDDFKQINDRHGHLAGDTALKEFTQRLQRASRGSDVVARLGGDEFLLLLPECGPAKMEIVLTRLRGLEFDFRGTWIPLAFSVGWADYRHGQSAEGLLDAADQALYQSKHGTASGTYGAVIATSPPE